MSKNYELTLRVYTSDWQTVRYQANRARDKEHAVKMAGAWSDSRYGDASPTIVDIKEL